MAFFVFCCFASCANTSNMIHTGKNELKYYILIEILPSQVPKKKTTKLRMMIVLIIFYLFISNWCTQEMFIALCCQTASKDSFIATANALYLVRQWAAHLFKAATSDSLIDQFRVHTIWKFERKSSWHNGCNKKKRHTHTLATVRLHKSLK